MRIFIVFSQYVVYLLVQISKLMMKPEKPIYTADEKYCFNISYQEEEMEDQVWDTYLFFMDNTRIADILLLMR